MSVKKLSNSGVDSKTLSSDDTWVRPSSWLTLPTVLETDQKFVGLHAVYPEGNFCALSASGNYVINWGDGTGDQNISAGLTAQTDIAWANAPATSDVGIADARACTFTDSGDTVDLTAHDYENGAIVAFSTITSTTGLTTYTSYYVVNKDANTFQVSTTIGGSAIALTTDGNGAVYTPRYRQVIVTVTMQSGQNMTALNLHVKHLMSGLQTYTSKFLEIALAGQYITDFRLGVQSPGSSTQVIYLNNLESVNIVSSNLKQCEYLFFQCRSLVNIINLATSTDSASSSSVTFTDTGDLVTHVSHGRLNGESVIFSTITSTTDITAYTRYFIINKTVDTYQVSTTYGGAAVLLTTNGSGTAIYGTTFMYMFYNCYSLTTVPLFNTASGITFNSMFRGCFSLTTVPLFNTSAGTNFSGMFSNCYPLTTVPLFNTSAGTNFSSMFSNCYSLTTVPLFNTSAGTNFSSMFSTCQSLTTVPLFNTSAGTNFSSMFQNCYSLTTVPLFNTSAGTNFSSMFNGSPSISSAALSETSISISYINCTLSATELNRIYINLHNVGSGSAATTYSTDTLTKADHGLTEGQVTQFSSIINTTGIIPATLYYVRNPTTDTFQLSLTQTGAILDLQTSDGNATFTSQTITVTGNYGVTGDTPSIATAKGWTVTG